METSWKKYEFSRRVVIMQWGFHSIGLLSLNAGTEIPHASNKAQTGTEKYVDNSVYI
jgi:hypothetical protein